MFPQTGAESPEQLKLADLVLMISAPENQQGEIMQDHRRVFMLAVVIPDVR